MGRPSVKNERKRQIAKGMMSVMASKGYDGATMPEIAKASGLGQGLIHHNFKNKEEILLAVLDELVALYNTTLNEKLSGVDADPEKQLSEFIDCFLKLGVHSNPEALACWIIISGEALKKKEVSERFESAIKGFVTTLTEIVENGTATGRFQCDSAAAAACAITAAIQGYFVLSATSPNLIPKGSAATSTKAMAEGLLDPEM